MDRPQIISKLAAEVADRKLAFPTSVGVALKIREALEDPDCHIEAAAKLVQAEPLLAARIVAIANSATYNRSGREVSDVRSAVSKLGFSVIRNLATALVTRQMAGAPKTPREVKLAADLWEYTAHVASLSRLIARDVTHLDPDSAMFAAIVHDIGGFYLLSRSADFPNLLNEGMTDDDLEAELALCRAILGVIGVPPSVLKAVDEFWAGYLELPPVTLGDTLLLAAGLSPKPRPLDHQIIAPDSSFRASINLTLGKQTLDSILSESADEVRSLADALKF
ncbi:MAG TPA: HDOD domain-containing protein [Rhodocyclaceae bacterium]|nr:HDOD domain-containing protein [Rhodocyclaceae bacterium]